MNVIELKDRVQLQSDRIAAEVLRAMAIHAPMHSTHEAYAVILEEVEEFWENVKQNTKKMSTEALHIHRREMQTELLHIAAMCIRATIDCDLMG